MVVTAGKRPPFASDEIVRMVQSHQRSLATLSPQGRQIVAEKSRHFVQRDTPEIVIRALREVVGARPRTFAEPPQRRSTRALSLARAQALFFSLWVANY